MLPWSLETEVKILDIECYRNYFLAMFVNPAARTVQYFEKFNDVDNANLVVPDDLLVTFNGINYDIPMLGAAVKGYSNDDLKNLSDRIILDRAMPWELPIDWMPKDHIDIMNVLPGRSGLKIYGGRIGTKRLQDLPVEPDAIITADQVPLLRKYCRNDCIVTNELYEKVGKQINLREIMSERYDLDLRSKSDAQIAEAVIRSEYQRLQYRSIPDPNVNKFCGENVHVSVPSYVHATPGGVIDELIQDVKAMDVPVKMTGKVDLPAELKGRKIHLAGKQYKMGIGGLHSVDKAGSFYASDEMELVDIDVTSYYPSIILNSEFYPKHIGPIFLRIYRKIVEDRVDAKANGDKVVADSLKITINGSFGKMGSVYSKLYSPDLMVSVTVVGQLCLLMLIERLGNAVISANTDGITLHFNRRWSATIEKTVKEWEQQTGCNMEWTKYRSLHRRDVNNYLAITPDGGTKTKGIFATESLMKNPVNLVCIDAIKQYLLYDRPVDIAIRNCRDISRFVTLRTVKGGAQKDFLPLGKSIRWYYAKGETTPIYYISNGNTVPRSEQGVPLMDLPNEIPADLDYEWYIEEANIILDQILR